MKVEGGSQATADVETAITAAMASTEPIGARGTATIDDGAGHRAVSAAWSAEEMALEVPHF